VTRPPTDSSFQGGEFYFVPTERGHVYRRACYKNDVPTEHETLSRRDNIIVALPVKVKPRPVGTKFYFFKRGEFYFVPTFLRNETLCLREIFFSTSAKTDPFAE
jgi:hypothetical protein